jgi:hypothetical protein
VSSWYCRIAVVAVFLADFSADASGQTPVSGDAEGYSDER